jgi:CRISPR-associated protein Csx3
LTGVRIIVGGPPNSGKSTFVIRLSRSLWEIGVDVKRVELDAWAPTLDYIDGKITKEERDSQKRSAISGEDAEKSAQRFQESSKDASVVIGDCPGKISEELRIIMRNATHSIILCRADQINEMSAWRAFFSGLGIPVVAELVSDLKGTEGIFPGNFEVLKGRFVGLDRTTRKSPAISQFAFHLKSRLGL